MDNNSCSLDLTKRKHKLQPLPGNNLYIHIAITMKITCTYIIAEMSSNTWREVKDHMKALIC